MLTEFTPPIIDKRDADWWIQGLGSQDLDNEVVGLTIMTLFRKPKTMVDFGSGTGCMVNVWRANGIDAYGVDRLPRPDWPHLYQADLTKPVRFDRQFDVVTCIEVAEHLPESSADTLCETLYVHVKAGGFLVFTSAQPGQQGEGHVHLKPSEYWRKKFDALGLTFTAFWTFRLMLALRTMDHPQRHIEANLQVFQMREAV